MIILWALTFITKAVGLVLSNQASINVNDTQVGNFGAPPTTDYGPPGLEIALDRNVHIPRQPVEQIIRASFGVVCLEPFTAHLGSTIFRSHFQPNGWIEIEEAPSSEGSLTVGHAMLALLLCFYQLNVSTRASPQYNPATCRLGYPLAGSQEIAVLICTVYIRGRSQSAISSVGSNVSVSHVSVAKRRKQRDIAVPAATTDVNLTITDQDATLAATNTSGRREPSSLGDLDSAAAFRFRLPGNGPQILLNHLLVSVMEAVLDQARRPRSGPIYARSFTPVLGKYKVDYRGTPGRNLAYTTVCSCLFGIFDFVWERQESLREGGWTCDENYQDVMIGSFTRKPDALPGIAASPTTSNEPLDLAARNYE